MTTVISEMVIAQRVMRRIGTIILNESLLYFSHYDDLIVIILFESHLGGVSIS